MIDLAYHKGLAALSAIPREQKAIPDASGLVSGLARADSQQRLQTIQTDTQRRGVENAFANERADQRLANRDAKLAVGVGIGSVGLTAIGVNEQYEEAKAKQKRDEEEADYWDSLAEIVQSNYERSMEFLKPKDTVPEQAPTYNTNETYLNAIGRGF